MGRCCCACHEEIGTSIADPGLDARRWQEALSCTLLCTFVAYMSYTVSSVRTPCGPCNETPSEYQSMLLHRPLPHILSRFLGAALMMLSTRNNSSAASLALETTARLSL